MSRPGEPTPAGGDDIPESVLRELRTVFAERDDRVVPTDPSDAASLSVMPADGDDEPDASASEAAIDFDDPDLDALLGLAARADQPPLAQRGVSNGASVVPTDARPDAASVTPEGPGRESAGDRDRGRDRDPAGAARPPWRQRRRDEKATKAARRAARKAARKAAREGTADDGRVAPAAPGVAPSEVVSTVPAAPATTIVIGGDDDLPDALYLDDVGEARLRDVHPPAGGARSGGATIVIGDELDSSGAFDAVPVPTRSMDPRVRARRIAVKRAAGRRRLVWVGIVAVVVVLLVGTLAVFSSSLFDVEDVRVQGAAYTELYDRAELQAVIDDLTGEPILLVDTLAAERRLELIPWIERAIVTTDFPDAAMIDVRERQPLAAFRGASDGKYRIIDREGRVLSLLDGQPVDYMLIEGLAPDTERGALAGAPWAAAAQLVASLPAEIRDITAAASVDAATGDLGLVLQPAIAVRIGGFAGLDAKLARLLQLVRDGLTGIVNIDVSTPEVSVIRG